MLLKQYPYFSSPNSGNAPLITEARSILDGYRVMNGAESFDLERNPPEIPRRRVSTLRKQLQSAPACREHLSDERDFAPIAENPTVLNGSGPYFLRSSPFLSDSHRDFVLLNFFFFHYDLMEKKK